MSKYNFQIIQLRIKKFLYLGPEGRKKEPGIGRDRAELIMSGSAIMQTLLRLGEVHLVVIFVKRIHQQLVLQSSLKQLMAQ